jgi:hypothetical protein
MSLDYVVKISFSILTLKTKLPRQKNKKQTKMNSSDTHDAHDTHVDLSSSIRLLAVDDLIRAIHLSNKKLSEEFQIDCRFLKNDSTIERLVINTEETMFKYSLDIETYFETLTALLIFLSDKKLSQDAVLFRFLINIDIEDMFIEPDSAELLFSELFYTTGFENEKKQVLDTIISQIDKRVEQVMYDYANGNRVVTCIAPLRYKIPQSLQVAIDQYRDEQLEIVLDRLSSIHPNLMREVEEEDNDEDVPLSSDEEDRESIESIYSIGSWFSPSEQVDSIRSPPPSSDSSPASLAQKIKEIESKSNSYSVHSGSNIQSNIKSRQSGQSGIQSVKSGVKSSIQSVKSGIKFNNNIKSKLNALSYSSSSYSSSSGSFRSFDSSAYSSSSNSSSSNSSSPPSPSPSICHQCKKNPFEHSYKTICFDSQTGKQDIVCFCSNKCMENWKPPKNASPSSTHS